MLLGRTVVVSLLVGVVVTVAAAVLPAVRAARVPPIAAINGIRPRLRGDLRGRLVGGSIVTAIGAAVLAYGVDRADHARGLVDQAQVVALGAFIVLVGVVAAAMTSWPRTRSGGRWFVCGVTGSLAGERDGGIRVPRRITGSALVIGLKLVGLTATFSVGARYEDTGQGRSPTTSCVPTGRADRGGDRMAALPGWPWLSRSGSTARRGKVETGRGRPIGTDDVVDLDT